MAGIYSDDRTWLTVVSRFARTAGVHLSQQTIDELAAHLEDLYLAARDRGTDHHAARQEPIQELESSGLLPLRTEPRPDSRASQSRTANDISSASRSRSFAMAYALRMALRQFRLHPAFALITVLVLGLGTPRLLMTTLTAFGGLAAFLAALGVYGLFSWSVALRQRELAIRLTLGARPVSVAATVVRQSVLLAVIGLACGFALVQAARGALATVLFGVTPTDVTSTVTAGVLLFLAAIVASLPAALRAMRVDPVEGLRAEQNDL